MSISLFKKILIPIRSGAEDGQLVLLVIPSGVEDAARSPSS
jgi:hypothetical protein